MDAGVILLGALVALCVIKMLILIYDYFWAWIMVRKMKGLPDRAYPLIGHAMLFSGPPEVVYETLENRMRLAVKKGHEVSYLWMGSLPLIFILGPNAAEELLHSSKNIEKAYLYNFLHSWLGTGLLTSKGEKWKTRRRLITPTFHFSNSILTEFLNIMNDESKIFVNKLESHCESGESFNIANKVTLCALDIICQTAMGCSIHAQDNEESEYVKALFRVSEMIQDRQKSPWLWPEFIYNHTPQGKEYKKSLKVLHGFTRSVIEDRIKIGLKCDGGKTKKKRLAFLDMLLNVATEGNLSLDDVQEEVDTFMFEGHDTTAAAMAWAIQLIGSHPEIQKRIQDELDEVLGPEAGTQITMENIKKLQYLEMAIKESLRLFPSVPYIARTITSECMLDGYKIHVGSQCNVYTQMINTNDNYWPDAQKFDPERFTIENSAGRHPYLYLPFSAGSRNCIGQKFALMEEKVMLAYLLHKFSIESCEPTDSLKKMSDLILHPATGINIRIKHRLGQD